MTLMPAMTSCDDFLDVRPKGEKVEDDLFKDSSGFEDAIYGVYGSLVTETLYGRDLLWGLTDVMAQDLDCGSSELVDDYLDLAADFTFKRKIGHRLVKRGLVPGSNGDICGKP